MTSNIDIEGALAALAVGTMRADEILQASQRIMTAAKGSPCCQAAAYRGQALYAQGRISEAITLTEEAWRLADKLDDPIAAGLTAIFGGVCCATLYDYRQAQAWYTRELDRARSRLVVSLRQPLCDLLASALVSQGDAEGGSTAAGTALEWRSMDQGIYGSQAQVVFRFQAISMSLDRPVAHQVPPVLLARFFLLTAPAPRHYLSARMVCICTWRVSFAAMAATWSR